MFAFAYSFAVDFYGKEKSTDVKLPVKTDHDTLREGYRYAFFDKALFSNLGLNFIWY